MQIEGLLNGATEIGGYLILLSLMVSIIVQMIKEYIPIPTKALVLVTSLLVTLFGLLVLVSFNVVIPGPVTVFAALFASFLVGYISMYGFDTFKNLYEKMKNGEGGC